MLSPSSQNGSEGIARPKTRNPKLNQLVEHNTSIESAMLESSIQTTTPNAAAAGTNASAVLPEQPIAQLGSKGSFIHQGDEVGEVLWSEKGEDIPVEKLARPGTSNPRYARDTPTPKRGGNTPPVQVEAAPRGDSPPAAAVAEGSLKKETSTGGVLWAAEGTELDPNIIARPITSNPWLSRVIDSSSSAATLPNELSPPSLKSNAVNGSGGSGKGSMAENQANNNSSGILWSSAEVDDWRMLARPHAANPKYEAARDSSPVEEPPIEASGGRRVSEILWKRDETNDEIIVSQRVRIEELEREVALLKAQLLHHGLTPASNLPIPTKTTQQATNGVPTTVQEVHNMLPLGTAEAAAASTVSSFKERNNAPASVADGGNSPAGSGQYSSPLGSVGSKFKGPNIAANRPMSAKPTRPGTTKRSGQEEEVDPAYSSAVMEEEGLITNDDTPDEEVDPQLINGGLTTPPTTRTKPKNTTSSSSGGGGFVEKINSEVAQQRPGTAQPTRSKVNVSQQQQQQHTGGKAPVSSSTSTYLQNQVGTLRPQSAPLERAIVSSPTKTKFMSSVPGVARTISTTALHESESDSMMVEYYNMLKPGAKYVEKADFAEQYKKRAEEYGVLMSDKQLERVLHPYRAAGPNHLTMDEFNILFLKLQQW